MKTLYLHIGLPKTATTSLQYFCVENEKIFNEKGYTYPVFERKFYRINKYRNGAFLVARIKGKNGERNTIEEDKLYRQNMDIIIENFQKYDNVILSNEGIWNAVFTRNVNTSLWEKLKKEAAQHGFNVKILVYLRRQDSYTDSGWNQKVKSGKKVGSTWTGEYFIENVNQLIQLDYYNTLKNIEDILGKDNIIVRRFGRQYFKNGSVFEDFVDAIGMKYSSRFVISETEKNQRLYGNAIEIKRMVNCIPDFTMSENLFFRKICFEMSDNHPEWKNQTMFSPEEAAAFMEKYRDGNREIMRKYFGKDEDLFDMDFSDNHKWVYDQESMQNSIIEFIGILASKTREENKILQQRLDDMEKKVKEQETTIENMKQKPKSSIKSFFSSIRK
ncbi:MAG: hypothetical protein LUF92_17830 [Clostridiales bacterium]|nr:hypothetical protein [Clostridiales bacterium]